jgi:3-phosphoshikimate 1-carboxyvinyltransferase
MQVRISPHAFTGTVRIPASKSHTIRCLLIAALAEGASEIKYPLDSLDARSCAAACRAFGAEVTEHRAADPQCPNPAAADGKKLIAFNVQGNNGFKRGGCFPDIHSLQPPTLSAPPSPAPGFIEDAGCELPPKCKIIDVGNSGTTLYLAMAAAGIGSDPFAFTGDEQIQKRSAAPLLEALAGFGIRAESVRRNGCAPIVIQGGGPGGPLWKGGRVALPCPTSQYLSALLISAPLAPAGILTEIEVPLLNERPYVEMTLSYLDAQNIPYTAVPDFSRFAVPGGASWKPFSRSVPGDFSSAAFPACAAAISGGPVTILGLDPTDLQGDKFFLEMLASMGCAVHWEKIHGSAEYRLTVSRCGPLRGGTFDLNATPDLLPAAAVTAAFAEGDTALVNVAHARIKETDRIAVMAAELAKLGIRCTEQPDGLIIHGNGLSGVSGGCVDSCGDHRIAMAFAAAALGAQGPVAIDGAECAAVTYPGFLELLAAEELR